MTRFGTWPGRKETGLRVSPGKKAGFRVVTLIGIAAALSACAGAGEQIESGVDAARRAVHQRCHSEYNSCRMAAGPQKVQQQACQDQLAQCVSVPSTE